MTSSACRLRARIAFCADTTTVTFATGTSLGSGAMSGLRLSSSLYIRSLARYWSNFFGFFAMYAPHTNSSRRVRYAGSGVIDFRRWPSRSCSRGQFPFPGETSNYRPSHSLRGEHASAAMTRYFFHIKYKAKMILDEEGMDLRDLDAVREEAEESARQITS